MHEYALVLYSVKCLLSKTLIYGVDIYVFMNYDFFEGK